MRGRLVAGGSKENQIYFKSDRDAEQSFMELALRVKMRQEFDKQLGPVNFAMSVREKVIALSMPLGTDILYIVATSEYNFADLPKLVIDIIKKS